jgi:uncharacterized protein
MVERISAAQARRVAIAAQGLADRRPQGRLDRRHVRKIFDRVGLVQIDSVNVLARSHEIVLFSRLGPYQRGVLDRMVHDGELFEYWAHEASYIPAEHQPLLRFKMERDHWVSKSVARLEAERPGYLQAVLDEVRDNGPLSAGELKDPGKKKGPWWGWAHGKWALEVMLFRGDLAARRRPNFEREYDLPERMLPAHVVAMPRPTDTAARAALAEMAAASMGVATEADIADYYRMGRTALKPIIEQMVGEGRLIAVQVEGWTRPAYMVPNTRMPRRVNARSVLTPFDSLVWSRERTERLFDFRYRIEIYTPAPKRVYGYYVLPFLLGDELVGRVDLKADRKASALLVQAAWMELGVPEREVAHELADELREVATWLELDRITVVGRGDLSPALTKALRTR